MTTKKQKIPEGRFEYDLLTQLDYDPFEKKPYRVRVWTWRDSARSSTRHWYEAFDDCFGYGGGFPHSREFKSLEKAVKYLYEVRGDAEYRHISRNLQDKRESRREVLA